MSVLWIWCHFRAPLIRRLKCKRSKCSCSTEVLPHKTLKNEKTFRKLYRTMGGKISIGSSSARLITKLATSITASGIWTEVWSSQMHAVSLKTQRRNVFPDKSTVSGRFRWGFCLLPLVARVGNVGITLWSLWRKPLCDCRVAGYEKLSFNSGFERTSRAVKYEHDSGLYVDRWS